MSQYNECLNQVKEYTIYNDELEVSAINFGASVTAIKTRDKEGNMENILASFQDIESYFSSPGPYLNAMVGPVAGRIAYGKYEIDGETRQLSINNGVNHLHGGASGISKQFFDVIEEVIDEKKILRFVLDTNHVVDGFSGDFHYEIKYILEKNTFTIESTCWPKQRTILNMTSHMYFNLSGELKRSIEGHLLMVPANHKTLIHDEGHPYEIVPIESGSAFDFRVPKKIGENFEIGDDEFAITRGYDTCFVLDNGNKIVLEDEISGRILEVITDQRSVVVYSANYFDEQLILNEGRKGQPFCSIALETQDIPNVVNIAPSDAKIYDENSPYSQKTTYIFGMINE